MGNSLGCVKEQKEKAAGMAPLPPKKRVRFKRRRRGKKRAVPAVAPREEAAVRGEDEDPKLAAAPQHEEPDGSRHPAGDPGPGRIVQVKERFQGELQKARLVLEPGGAGTAGDSREEGTTVIARLLENPAERGCERSVGRLVRLQRGGPGSTRAVLLPLPHGPDGIGKHCSEGSAALPAHGEQPARSWGPAASSSRGAGGSGEPSSSAAWTSAAEPGTVSELSTPSPMVEQMENPGVGKPPGLPASRSASSSGGTARCSSGYGSERAGSAGAAGAEPCPAEGAHTAQHRALLGSSRPSGGTVSACVCHRLLFRVGWGDPVQRTPGGGGCRGRSPLRAVLSCAPRGAA
ncbi:collagen alpha-1(III) chain-like [Cyrtonyx montezumae]|uniref:collagen alpha-1(III) chain-like n=1 Tax=Cyrtonyx montezumae TaxID=9017 RepID=UPI0032DB9A06